MGAILAEIDDAFDGQASFLSRQFGSEITRKQLIFDGLFGVVLPILCFIADPIVFKSGGFGAALFPGYQLLAYLVSGFAILTLLVWMCAARHLTVLGPMFCGIFIAGAVFSAVIGIVIFPYAAIGLIFLIGLAGFIPFVTAFVYLRNGIRAFNRSQLPNDGAKGSIAVMSAGLTIGFFTLINYQITAAVATSVQQLIRADAVNARAAADRLSWFPFVPEESLDEIVRAYDSEQDLQKKAVLKQYYCEATGDDIEVRSRILND